MIILKLLGKLVKALKSEDSPRQMAWGFAIGAFLGFMPLNTLFTLFTFLAIFLLRINFASAMLAFGLFSIFADLLDPIFHDLGFLLLVNFSFLKTLFLAKLMMGVLNLESYFKYLRVSRYFGFQ